VSAKNLVRQAKRDRCLRRRGCRQVLNQIAHVVGKNPRKTTEVEDLVGAGNDVLPAPVRKSDLPSPH
jgi:hypothetical protein